MGHLGEGSEEPLLWGINTSIKIHIFQKPGIYSRLFFIAFGNLGGIFNYAAYTYVRNKVTDKDT